MYDFQSELWKLAGYSMIAIGYAALLIIYLKKQQWACAACLTLVIVGYVIVTVEIVNNVNFASGIEATAHAQGQRTTQTYSPPQTLKGGIMMNAKR